MKPVSDMTPERLRAELAIAEGQKHSHREGVFGSCYQRCEDPFPCDAHRRAVQTIGDVSAALDERQHRIEQVRLEWR